MYLSVQYLNNILVSVIFSFLLQCDLIDMPAIGQLEKDAKYSLVYQLLKIFLTQRLDAYLEFQAANSTLLKSYGTSLNLCSCLQLYNM